MTLLSTTQSKFIIILVLVGFLTYGVVLQNGFVWDDFDQVVNNKGVHSLSNIGYIFSGSTFNSGGADKLVGVYYKPLMPFSFAILYSLFGPNAVFFHGFQLLIHIANALLLFLFLRRYLKDWSAFIASL
ncbi:MAG: hypothetical protein HYT10_03310, partial [Candidatus Levybacteria bacterium]|nr:hypothetical protein [Candidatus Levybacteria bacterium]